MVLTPYSKAQVLLCSCRASFLRLLRLSRAELPRIYLHALTFRAADVACQPGPVAVITEVNRRLDEAVLEFAVEQYRACCIRYP